MHKILQDFTTRRRIRKEIKYISTLIQTGKVAKVNFSQWENFSFVRLYTEQYEDAGFYSNSLFFEHPEPFISRLNEMGLVQYDDPVFEKPTDLYVDFIKAA